jgi:integrase
MRVGSLQVVLEAAKLPRITFHDLRHSCASLMLAQGVPARVVMEILGHSDVRLTMNLYTHVAEELKREASDRMEVFLREAT